MGQLAKHPIRSFEGCGAVVAEHVAVAGFALVAACGRVAFDPVVDATPGDLLTDALSTGEAGAR